MIIAIGFATLAVLGACKVAVALVNVLSRLPEVGQGEPKKLAPYGPLPGLGPVGPLNQLSPDADISSSAEASSRLIDPQAW